jgi:putative salt-induced outer membrane protein
MKKLTLAIGLCLAIVAKAEDAKTFKGESEASAIITSGNSETESIGAKTTNTWSLSENDLATIFGKYVSSKSQNVQTGKNWEAGLRYERVITKDQFSVFLQHKAQHDPYNGPFVQRDTTDLGVKYVFIKNDNLNWFSELGYSQSSTYSGLDPAPVTDRYTAGSIRAYTEAAYKFNASTSGKLWVEHLANLKDTDKSLTNAEASLSVVMTDILSLKTAYLVNHNEGAPTGSKKDSSTWTTALVAKY